MNRISKTLKEKDNILSIYFTAGFPEINSTNEIIKNLVSAGVDMIEIGLPFSDPLADGETIQMSSKIALDNGISTNILFEQLKEIRNHINIPLIIMGYFNPIFQFGVEDFCKKCNEIGIDGLIIPDLPIDIYLSNYKRIFEKNRLQNIFLITPQTSNKRIEYIDKNSDGFLYVVSSSSITGSTNKFDERSINYFKKLEKMNLSTPKIIGFGISNNENFSVASKYSKGCIVGSAFIKYIQKNGLKNIHNFINQIKKGN